MKVTGLKGLLKFIKIKNLKVYIKEHRYLLIAFFIALLFEILFISFVLYYPLKVIEFGEMPFGGTRGASDDSTVVTTLDEPEAGGPAHSQSQDTQVHESEGPEQVEKDKDGSLEKQHEEAIQETSPVSVDSKQDQEDISEQESKDISDEDQGEPIYGQKTDVEESAEQEEVSTPASTVFDIPEPSVQPVEQSPIESHVEAPSESQVRPGADDRATSQTRRKRRVRKIIKRKRISPKRARAKKREASRRVAASLFSKDSLSKAREAVSSASASKRGQASGQARNQKYAEKYAYVYQRLQQEQMFSYKCRIGKILQAEFARYKTPIIFPESMNHYMPGKIIINRDGSVKDYICESPTGVPEFDRFIKRIIMQTKFRPLPSYYPYDTHEEPFNPSVQAQKGTNVFRLYVRENRDYNED